MIRTGRLALQSADPDSLEGVSANLSCCLRRRRYRGRSGPAGGACSVGRSRGSRVDWCGITVEQGAGKGTTATVRTQPESRAEWMWSRFQPEHDAGQHCRRQNIQAIRC